MIRRLIILAVMLGIPALARADIVAAKRTIRAHSILAEDDLKLLEGEIADAYVSLGEVVGLEARKILYANRPIRIEDIGPPALVVRNQIVPLIFLRNGLRISTDARSLSRAGVGDSIRVMNLSSKTIVSGLVGPDGHVYVGNLPTQ